MEKPEIAVPYCKMQSCSKPARRRRGGSSPHARLRASRRGKTPACVCVGSCACVRVWVAESSAALKKLAVSWSRGLWRGEVAGLSAWPSSEEGNFLVTGAARASETRRRSTRGTAKRRDGGRSVPPPPPSDASRRHVDVQSIRKLRCSVRLSRPIQWSTVDE